MDEGLLGESTAPAKALAVRGRAGNGELSDVKLERAPGAYNCFHCSDLVCNQA